MMFEQLPLNTVECDWLTFSSKEQWPFDFANSIMDSVETKDTKVLQYHGRTWSPLYGGSMFAGEGLQGEDKWYLIRLSGVVASHHWRSFARFAHEGIGKITRFDLQTTAPSPEWWSQFELFKRLEEENKKPSLIQSTEKETGWTLATVSIGSRHSEAYVRIYEKLYINDATRGYEKALRYEVEYKGAAAPAVAQAVFLDEDKAKSGILHRLDKIGDELLIKQFPTLTGIEPAKFVIAHDDYDRREHWFVGSVVPALERFLNETNNSNVANLIQDVIAQWEESAKIGILDVDAVSV